MLESRVGRLVGLVVHFVMADGSSKGVHRPAVIVREWNAVRPGYVNLQVITDGRNDGAEYASGLYWATSVDYSAEPLPRTWHFAEEVHGG